MTPATLHADAKVTALARRSSSAVVQWGGKSATGALSVHGRVADDHVQRVLAARALLDPLTGLPNRSALMAQLRRALHAGQHLVGVLFLDLDGFKLVNDGLGHATGDHLLRAVALRIRERLEGRGFFGRFGGDEFIVVLPDVDDVDDALDCAERIVAALDEPFEAAGVATTVGVSIGIAVGTSSEPAELIRHADVAMYEAKRTRRTTVFHQALDEAATRRLELAAGLRRAAQSGELRVRFEGVHDLESGRRFGAEAVMYWAHPDLGVVEAGEIVPLAEEIGSADLLAGWLVDQAVDMIASTVVADGWVSVDVSSVQLRRPELVDRILATVSRAGSSPSRLMVEVNQSSLFAAGREVAEGLERLRDAGAHVAVDDFGIGRADLAGLLDLPVDAVKVPERFVAELGGADGRAAAIVGAIVTMAASLGIHVIAQGVDTEAQRARLCELGVRLGQGQLFEGAATRS